MRHIGLQVISATLVLWTTIAATSCADSVGTAGGEPADEADVGRNGVNADAGPSMSHPALWESSLEFGDISAGYEHTCGLTDDGQIMCWGLGSDEVKNEQSFDYAQAYVPDNAGWQRVSAGGYFTCGVRVDGSLACWGQGSDPGRDELYQDHDQAVPPSGIYDSVSAGGVSACALSSSGGVTCWGADGHGLSEPPASKVVHVSVGGAHGCAITSEQRMLCWGEGAEEQEPIDGLFTYATSPSGTFTKVSSGRFHTCGLRTDGTVSCWGMGSDPEQANTDSLWAALAKGQAIAPLGRFLDISAGSVHTCGIRDDQTVECWGAGRTPYRADPSDDFQRRDPHCDPYDPFGCNQSMAPPGRFQKVSAGGSHTCALRLDGRVVCWGTNNHGQASPPSSEKIAPEIFAAD